MIKRLLIGAGTGFFGSLAFCFYLLMVGTFVGKGEFNFTYFQIISDMSIFILNNTFLSMFIFIFMTRDSKSEQKEGAFDELHENGNN